MPRFPEPHENHPSRREQATELLRAAHDADMSRLDRAIQRALYAHERLNYAEDAMLATAAEEAATLAGAIEHALQEIAAPERMGRAA